MPNTYLFLGDSITDADRLWLPETDGLGCGYVSFLSAYIKEKEPYARVINKGHDGFTVPALLHNLPSDCFSYQPDFVSVLIGINDVGVAMNTNTTLKNLCFADDYERMLDLLLEKTNARLLLMGPFLFAHPQKYLLWMDAVREAEDTIAVLAVNYHVPFLPLNDTLNEAAKKQGFDAITVDGIHLTQTGHRLLAELVRPFL